MVVRLGSAPVVDFLWRSTQHTQRRLQKKRGRKSDLISVARKRTAATTAAASSGGRMVTGGRVAIDQHVKSN